MQDTASATSKTSKTMNRKQTNTKSKTYKNLKMQVMQKVDDKSNKYRTHWTCSGKAAVEE